MIIEGALPFGCWYKNYRMYRLCICWNRHIKYHTFLEITSPRQKKKVIKGKIKGCGDRSVLLCGDGVFETFLFQWDWKLLNKCQQFVVLLLRCSAMKARKKQNRCYVFFRLFSFLPPTFWLETKVSSLEAL